ncbi:MAG: hypothetical protein K6T88_02595 [Bacillus sp. (in: Bacteria)]|nr:hypothetical protein [Bacillus sp. (in: firmicutes)]
MDNTVSTTTFTPFSQSSHVVSSTSQWLFPFILGTNTIAVGMTLAMIERHVRRRLPSFYWNTLILGSKNERNL